MATYLIDKYEEEYDFIEKDIDNILQVLIEEKDLICDNQKYIEILKDLIYIRYKK